MSAAQAAGFYAEALCEGSVWTVRDDAGYPAPVTSDGGRAQPFWSLRSRAESVVAGVPAYAGFVVEEIPLDRFRSRWPSGLERDGIRVGRNWSGARATGYDHAAPDVQRNLAAAGPDGPVSERTGAAGRAVRRWYLRRWDESRGDEFDHWGPAAYYFETDHDGVPTRQIEVYDAGPTLRYGPGQEEDRFGFLAQVALHRDEDWHRWVISRDQFEHVWGEERPDPDPRGSRGPSSPTPRHCC